MMSNGKLAILRLQHLQRAHRQDPGHEAVGGVLQALQDERRLQRALVAVQPSAHLLRTDTVRCFTQSQLLVSPSGGAVHTPRLQPAKQQGAHTFAAPVRMSR